MLSCIRTLYFPFSVSFVLYLYPFSMNLPSARSQYLTDSGYASTSHSKTAVVPFAAPTNWFWIRISGGTIMNRDADLIISPEYHSGVLIWFFFAVFNCKTYNGLPTRRFDSLEVGFHYLQCTCMYPCELG